MKVRTLGLTMSLLASATPAWAVERAISPLTPAEFAALKPADVKMGDIKYTQNMTKWAEWTAGFPTEAKALALYPGYQEATYWARKGGQVTSAPEPLVFYYARSKTALNRRVTANDLKSMLDYAHVQKLLPDLTFAPAPITRDQMVASFVKSGARPNSFGFCSTNNQLNVTRQLFEINLDQSQPPPSAREPWCSNARSLCFEACAIVADARVRPLLEGYNLTQPEDQQKDPAEGLQAELRYFGNESERGDQKGTFDAITKIGTDVTGLLEVSIFYVNQIIQWGKVVVVLQPSPANPNETIMTTLVVVAVKSHSWFGAKGAKGEPPGLQERAKAKQIRQILMGEHFLNKDMLLQMKHGLVGGIPMFTQDTTKNLANQLEGSGS